MGFAEDLVKLSGAFKESMQDFSQQNAIKRANDNLQQIKKNQQIDELERRSQIKELGQGLGQQLLQAGASPQEAMFATKAFQPMAAQDPTTQIREAVEFAEGAKAQAEIAEAQRKQTEETRVALNNKLKLLGAKTLTKQAGKDEKRQIAAGQFTNDSIQFFQKTQKPLIEQMQLANTVGTFLTPTEGGEVDAAQVNAAIKSIVRTLEGGRLTDQDFRLARVNQDLFSGVQREFKRLATGEALPKDVDKLTKLAKVIQLKAQRQAKEKVSKFAAQRAKTFPGIDKNVLADQIIGQLGFGGAGAISGGEQEEVQPASSPTPPSSEIPGLEF